MIGVAWFFLYYFSFKYLILKFDFKTLGREDDEPDEKNIVSSGNETKTDRALLIIEGLGGQENILNLDCCATRLRVTVKDSSLISESLLKKSGSRAVLKSGTGVQVIYGPHVTNIKNEVNEILNG